MRNGKPGHVGYDTMTVFVNSVDHERNKALVTDTFGKRHAIDTNVRRGGGRPPRVNETWIVDHHLGFWSFAASITTGLPEITQVHDNNPALVALLTILEELGYIEDNSIPPPGPIETHEHPAPPP